MRYYGDFETTNENEEGYSRVYLWALTSGDYVKHGKDIESFFVNLITFKHIVIYFHNFSGFDSRFVLPYLLRNKICYETCEKDGRIYSLKFKLYDIKLSNSFTMINTNRGGTSVEIRDSWNYLPFNLKQIGEEINHKYKKTSIDYGVDFEHEATEEEIEYCINDCRVCEEGMETFYELTGKIINDNNWKKSFKKLYNKLTISGIAFECFKESSRYDKLCKNAIFDDEYLRKAYYGGYVYSNPKRVGKNVQMIDDNSMYPYVYSSIDMPYGTGTYCKTEEELKKFKFYVIRVKIKFELKKGYVPIIPEEGYFRLIGATYKSSSDNEFLEYTFCNLDFERIKRYYECEYEVLDGYGFMTFKSFYKDYADILIKIKSNNKGAIRQMAKLLLNSPYGKLALNPIKEEIEYYLDDDFLKKRVINSSIDMEGFNYIPQAIAITAAARAVLFTRAEQIGWENILYMDTDSIKYINPKNIKYEFNDYELGAWKDEGFAKYFKTIAPKKYCYFVEGEKSYIDFTCAGFNKQDLTREVALMCGATEEYIKENIDKNTPSKLYCNEYLALKMIKKFDIGLTIDCLQKKKVKCGVVLVRVPKEMKKKGL